MNAAPQASKELTAVGAHQDLVTESPYVALVIPVFSNVMNAGQISKQYPMVWGCSNGP